MHAMKAIFLLFGTTLLSTCCTNGEAHQVAGQSQAGVTINADGSGQWVVDECQPCGTVQWKSSGQSLNVMLKGAGEGYIALALSDDDLMGPSDQAYVCKTTGSQQFSIHSATLVEHGLPRFVENITLKAGSSMSSVNGMLSCNFTVDISTIVQNQVMQYYLLYAQGVVNETGTIQYHSTNRSSTTDLVCLTGNCQVATTPTPTTTSGAPMPRFNLLLFLSPLIVMFCFYGVLI